MYTKKSSSLPVPTACANSSLFFVLVSCILLICLVFPWGDVLYQYGNMHSGDVYHVTVVEKSSFFIEWKKSVIYFI